MKGIVIGLIIGALALAVALHKPKPLEENLEVDAWFAAHEFVRDEVRRQLVFEPFQDNGVGRNADGDFYISSYALTRDEKVDYFCTLKRTESGMWKLVKLTYIMGDDVHEAK